LSIFIAWILFSATEKAMKSSSLRMVIGVLLLLMTSKEALAYLYNCNCCCKNDFSESGCRDYINKQGDWGDGCPFACNYVCQAKGYTLGVY
jgi:hypothetical protein